MRCFKLVMTTGNNNTAIGRSAGTLSLTTANQNTMLGQAAGRQNYNWVQIMFV